MLSARATGREPVPASRRRSPPERHPKRWAGYCLDDERLTFDARERAYRLYRERGDGPSAARVAAWLAADCLEFRGEAAVANGWLQRAHSLLDELEPGPDHGWLAVHEASMLVEQDTATARRLARGARPEVWRAGARDGRAGARGAGAGQRGRPP